MSCVFHCMSAFVLSATDLQFGVFRAPYMTHTVSFSDESERVQKKTFLNWINSHLRHVSTYIRACLIIGNTFYMMRWSLNSGVNTFFYNRNILLCYMFALMTFAFAFQFVDLPLPLHIILVTRST